MNGIYPILDLESCELVGVPPLKLAEALLAARPTLLQLRAKKASARRTLDVLRALRPMTRAVGTLLFANDRPDLAVLADCDGVHLGQEDISLEQARSFAPHLRVGISTHNLRQLRAAVEQSPDYVAFGPLFPTHSKQNPDPCVSHEQLREAAAVTRAGDIPLVGIGGVTLAQLSEVGPYLDSVAVISVVTHSDPRVATGRLRELAAQFGSVNRLG